MSQPGDCLKVSQIAINKFMNLKHAVIDLTKYTSINGIAKSTAALATIAEAMKFVLNISDSDLGLYRFHENPSHDEMETEDEDFPFVEALIYYPDGNSQFFRKSIVNNRLQYIINEEVISGADYENELIKAEAKSSPFNTVILERASIDQVTSMTDKKRATFIEFMCSSQRKSAEYRSLVDEIEKVKIQIKASVMKQKELTANKKNIKTGMQSTEKRVDILKELEIQTEQLELLMLYNNNKILANSDEKLQERKDNLRALADTNKEYEKSVEQSAEVLMKIAEDVGGLEGELEQATKGALELQQSVAESKLVQGVQNAYNLNLDEQLKVLRSEIEDTRLELLKLDKMEAVGFTEDYAKLIVRFEVDNVVELRSLSYAKTMAGVEEYERLEKNINRSTKAVTNYSRDVESMNQQIEELEKERRRLKESLEEIDNLKHEQRRLVEVSKQFAEVEIKKYFHKNSMKVAELRDKIADELKKKFPQKVFGTITDLWKVRGSTTESQTKFMKARLGLSSNAVIVDCRQTAEDCIEFLRIKSYESVMLKFIILSELSDVKPTIKLLPGENLPENWPCEVIESFLDRSSLTFGSLDSAVSFILCPSLVFEDLHEAENALGSSGTKKVNVVSTEGLTCFMSNGTLEKYAQPSDEADFDVDDNQIDAKIENYEQLKGVNNALKQMESDIAKSTISLSIIENQISMMTIKREKVESLLRFIEGELKEEQKELQAIQADVDRTSHKQKYETINTAITEKKREFFKEFCQQRGIDNIEDYLKHSPDIIRKKSEALESRLEKLLSQEKNLISLRFPQVEDLLTEGLNEDLKIRETEVGTLLYENVSKKSEYFHHLEQFNHNVKTYEDYQKQVSDAFELVCDTVYETQMCYRDNYEILTRCYMDQDQNPLALDAGTMEDFFIMSEENDENEDFKVVEDQLKEIEVNFDKLKQSLKESDDMTGKIQELGNRIEKLQKQNFTATGNIADNHQQARLKRIREDLLAVSRTLTVQREKFAEIDTKLQEVKNARKRNFEEILAVLNEGIDEFCRFMFNDGVVANLEPSNAVEPYLGEVFYFWRTIDEEQYKVTESTENYIASLALMFAILKLKKQKFVILNDATKKIAVDVKAFFERQNYIQAVSLTSRVIDDNADFVIRPQSQSFSVVRMAH